MSQLRGALRHLFDRIDSLLEGAFGAHCNPLAQLGALGWLFFWIIAGSGLYLYAFFDTGVTAAYASVESLTHRQWWAGGVMRSLHRYASDAMVLVALVHLLREFAYDRLRGARWFAWVIGTVLLPLIFVCGITGYWMVWDRLGQYVAQTASDWLDVLPLFAEPLARNFLDPGHLSGRFFTLMAYIHIAAPLALLLFMWLHIQRHSEARVTPRRGLAIGTLAALLALSLLHPAISQPPADLATVPMLLPLDWFYLAVFPLIDRDGGTGVWLGALALGVLLLALPWLPPLRRPAPALVHLDNCNGCARCFNDCPFGAIEMVPRTDGRPYAQQPAVDPARCVSCGICVGACPTGTPFRRRTSLVAGIELPELSTAALREAVTAAAGRLTESPRTVVFLCRHGESSPKADASTAIVSLPCVGMLPPSFIDFVLSRHLADGVLLGGCRRGECHFRLGDRWTEERVAAQRDPALRAGVARDRIALSWRGPSAHGSRSADLGRFRAQLQRLSGGNGLSSGWQAADGRWTKVAQLALQLPCYVALVLIIGAFSSWPQYRALAANEAVIKLSFSHAAPLRHSCPPLTPAEMARLPINMRMRTDCRRDRWPVTVELLLDDRPLYFGTHRAAGLHEDGPATVYRRFAVPAERHTLTVRMRDAASADRYDHEAHREIILKPGQSFVVDFDSNAGSFTFR